MKRIINIFLLVIVCLSISGCGNGKSQDNSSDLSSDSKIESADDNTIVNVTESTTDSIQNSEPDSEANDSTVIPNREIVWLGDSLTQGSLGRDNDNLDNAPSRKLEELSGIKVDDYGFYGYNTHDIFWVYRDETQRNQSVDSSKIYVFWVGSNDWTKDGIPNCDTAPVIAEIDHIIEAGNLTDYIVMGTTARCELVVDAGNGMLMYQSINNDLKNHYGEHYLDVIDAVTEEGYGPDNIHLTQAAYDSVAQLLYDKLKEVNYIK